MKQTERERKGERERACAGERRRGRIGKEEERWGHWKKWADGSLDEGMAKKQKTLVNEEMLKTSQAMRSSD